MICTGVRACIGLLMAAAMGGVPLAAQAQQGKGLSDKSVNVLMEITWKTLPGQFRHPSGEVIVIDKTKKKEIMLPLDKAKEVVGVGYLSARAQYCDLAEEQNANFQTMIRRERASNQWSMPQIVFITLLHATTVGYLTGNVSFQFGEEGSKDAEVVTKGPVWKEPCSDKVRAEVKSQVLAYINEAPTTPAAKGPQPAKRAEPATTTKTK